MFNYYAKSSVTAVSREEVKRQSKQTRTKWFTHTHAEFLLTCTQPRYNSNANWLCTVFDNVIAVTHLVAFQYLLQISTNSFDDFFCHTISFLSICRWRPANFFPVTSTRCENLPKPIDIVSWKKKRQLRFYTNVIYLHSKPRQHFPISVLCIFFSLRCHKTHSTPAIKWNQIRKNKDLESKTNNESKEIGLFSKQNAISSYVVSLIRHTNRNWNHQWSQHDANSNCHIPIKHNQKRNKWKDLKSNWK